MPICRQELLHSFEKLEIQFSQALTEAKLRDDDFESIRTTFQQRLTDRLHEARGKLPDNNPLTENIKGFISLIGKTNEAWDRKISSRNKGLAFRAGFNDSLLVFVYGKVKSCKSSLGNYMAWGNTDPKDVEKAKVPPPFCPSISHTTTACRRWRCAKGGRTAARIPRRGNGSNQHHPGIQTFGTDLGRFARTPFGQQRKWTTGERVCGSC